MAPLELPRRESFRGNESARLRVVFVKLFPRVSTMLKPMIAGEGGHGPPGDQRSMGRWTGLGPSAPLYSADPAEDSTADGPASCRTSRVDGVVRRVDGGCLWLSPPGASRPSTEVGVRHDLPPSVLVQRLVGLSVRVNIVRDAGACDAGGTQRRDRTLTICGDDGRLWLIARSGTVQGVTHAVQGGRVLRVALSQRPAGPLVIGTSELQWLVSAGQPATLKMPDGNALHVRLIERGPDDTASYVLGDPRLFTDDWS